MIVGTAGHIDHGKTALLRALTGQDGDRRPAERARGMTIDLGYLYADLGDGQPTGFIDVPGHERFIHNMLAGASGIDLLLLVVAADDGVMPQTREHLAIAGQLGIRRALVALSKIDRVEPARVEQVRQQIGLLLDTGPFAGAVVFPLSSLTGTGVEALRKRLREEAGTLQQRNTQGYFRLPVDRAFNVPGAGIVITGTAFSGVVSRGDELLLGPSGQEVRVRGLRAQNREAERACAGQRIALNITGTRLALEQLKRGDWLLAPQLYAPTVRLDIDLRLLPGESRELGHWTPVHVHLGAQDVTGRIALLEQDALAPGQCGLAQLLLNAPTHAVQGDHLVIRDQSARRTLGGGRVLDPFAPARGRRQPQRLAQLRALRDLHIDQALPVLLDGAASGLDPQRLECRFNHPRQFWQLAADSVEVTTRQGPRLFAGACWRSLQQRLPEALLRFHQEAPDELGPDRDRLRRYAFSELERPVFIQLLEQALQAGQIAASGPWLHLPEHRVRLSEQDERLKEQLWPLLLEAGFDPPWPRDLARRLEQDEAAVRLLLRKLARLGLTHQVVRDLFYADDSIRHLAMIARQLQQEADTIRAAVWRDRIGIGRKRSIQLLEYFDRIGFTRRLGNERKIREDSALARFPAD